MLGLWPANCQCFNQEDWTIAARSCPSKAEVEVAELLWPKRCHFWIKKPGLQPTTPSLNHIILPCSPQTMELRSLITTFILEGGEGDMLSSFIRGAQRPPCYKDWQSHVQLRTFPQGPLANRRRAFFQHWVRERTCFLCRMNDFCPVVNSEKQSHRGSSFFSCEEPYVNYFHFTSNGKGTLTLWCMYSSIRRGLSSDFKNSAWRK